MTHATISRFRIIIISLFAVALTLNVIASLRAVLSFVFPSFGSGQIGVEDHKVYSYFSEDYPKAFPIDLSNVLLASDKFDQYELYGRQALLDWSLQVPRNTGVVRLGNQHRAFDVVAGHELHCLWRMALAMNYPSHPMSDPEHSLHCLDYIRQRVLCSPDLTLEPFNSLEIDEVKNAGVVYVCRDWMKLIKTMEDNFEDWKEFRSVST